MAFYKYLIVLTFAFFSQMIFGQRTFERIIGDANDDVATCVVETDSVYLVGGYSFTNSGNQDDIILKSIPKRAASSGRMYPFNTFSPFATKLPIEHLRDIKMLNNKEIIVAGDATTLSNTAPQNQNILISRLDADFTSLSLAWMNQYGLDQQVGNAVDEIAHAIYPTSDNHFVVTGFENRGNASDTTGYIVKVTADGTSHNIRTFTFPNGTVGLDVIESNAGTYLVTGYADLGTVSGKQLMILEFQNDLTWIKGIALGGIGPDIGTSIINISTGGYLVVGGKGKQEIVAIKLDNNLNPLWMGEYGGSQNDIGTDVVEACDGGFVICGQTFNGGSVGPFKGASDAALIKIDPNGNLLWSRTYGGGGNDAFRTLINTNDGGFIMAGITSANAKGHGNDDIYVVKTFADGTINDACASEDTALFSSKTTLAPAFNNLVQNTTNPALPMNGFNTLFPDTNAVYNESLDCYDTIKRLKAFAGDNYIMCTGDSITKAERTAFGGHPPYNYNWSPGKFLNDSTIARPTAFPDTTTLFIVEVTDGDCKQVKDSVLVTVGNASSAWSGLDSVYCSADMLDIITPVDTGGHFIGPGVHFNGIFWYFDPSGPIPGRKHFIGYVDKYGCDTTWKGTFIKAAPCVSDVVTDSTSGTIINPQGINTDCKGQIYVTNESHISKIDTFGNSRVIIGDTATNGYKDGHVDSARIDHPFGITVAADGTIYFCDNYNHSIRMFRNDTITTIVGSPPSLGKQKGTVDGVAGLNARLSSPFGLTLSPNDEFLYLTEADGTNPNRVLQVDLTSGDYFVTKLAGGGALDVVSPRKGDEANVYKCGHLVANNEDLYIAGTEKTIIYKYNFATDTIELFAGGFDDPLIINGHRTIDARFIEPMGISMNCSGELFVTDKLPNRVRLIDNDSVHPYFKSTDGLDDPTDISVFVKGYLDVANTGANNILRLTIDDWRIGPWNGLDISDFTYCLGEPPDTLEPLYDCGYYKGPGISYDGASDKFIFNPPNTTGDYILTYVYNVSYCTDSLKARFRVVDNPVLDVPPAAICSGDSATLDAYPEFIRYLWNTGDTTQTITVGDTGFYDVMVFDSNNCPAFDTTHVVERASPIAEAGPPHTICEGASVNIGGSPTGSGGTPPLRYNWFPAIDLDNDTISNPNAFPDTNRRYLVEVIDSFACTAIDSVDITVNPAPIANAGDDDTICNGESFTLDASGSTGTPTLTYNWDNGLGGGVSHTVTPSTTTVYYVTVTDGTGCANNDSIVVTVLPSLTADAGVPDTICNGDSILIGGTPTGLGGSGVFSYTWSPGSSLNKTDTANPLAYPSSTTTYSVTVTDDQGCTDNSSVTITVSNLTVDAGSNDIVCAGDTIALNSSVSNSTGGYDFTWSPAATLTDAKIADPGAFPATDTWYYLTVIDNAGCNRNDSVQIQTNLIPNATVSGDTTICGGESVNLTASGGVNYSWTPVAGLSDPGISNPIASPIDTTTYTVVVSDAAGCSDDTTVTVNVNQVQITVSPHPDTAMCEGDSIRLTAAGGISYSWSPDSGLNDTSLANPMASPLNTITYSIAVEDAAGCKGFDTVRVIVSKNLTANAGISDTICQGSDKTIGGSPTASGGIPGYSYIWSPAGSLSASDVANPVANPVGLTTFNLTVTDIVGCIDTDSVSLGIFTLPNAEAGLNDTICFDDTTQIGGSPSGSGTTGPYNYLWTPNNGISDDNAANPYASPINLTDSTMHIRYTLLVRDANTCENTDSMMLTLLPMAGANFALDSICYGDSVQLVGRGGTDYSWSPAFGLSDTDIFNPTAGPDTTTTYIVTVNSGFCDPVTDTATVKVNPLPTIVSGPDTSIYQGEVVQLFATGGTEYLWVTTNEMIDSANIPNPRIQPLDSSDYIVMVTNTYGCSNYDTVEIKIEKAIDIYVAEAFAPNGNVPENRELCVQGVGIAKIDFKIYNRWGQLIFETTDTGQCWDGTYEGEPQHTQTFGYILKAEDYEGNKYKRKGTVTILK
jgi:gliding motility-associated-like protein